MEPLKSSSSMATTAVLICFFLIFNLDYALAASGGRMGGWTGPKSSFTRSSSPSSSPPPRQSPPPSRRTRTYSPPPPRCEPPPVHHHVHYWAPTPGHYSPPCPPSMERSTNNGSDPVNKPVIGSLREFDVVIMSMWLISIGLLLLGYIVYRLYGFITKRKIEGHVLKLQVGLLNTRRSVQKDLNWIAQNADTSTRTGVHAILTETISVLQGHPDYWVSAYSSVEVIKKSENAQKKFEEFCNEESRKVDRETLVNVNNIKTGNSMPMRRDSTRLRDDEYIVVTILVATDGNAPKLLSIKNKKHLKKALQKLASFSSKNITGVEVLWTPQDEADNLSKVDFAENYYLLQPLT